MIDGMQFDTAIKLIELLTFLGGGSLILVRLGQYAGKFEQMTRRQSDEIKDLKNEVKEIKTVVSDLAVQSNRIDNISQRMTQLDEKVERLRQGHGFDLPFKFHPPVAQET